MRIVQIIGSKGGGGAENFFVRLAEALHAAGDEILVIAPPGSRVMTALDPSVPRQPVIMRGVWDLLARWQISRIIRRFKPDIVQTWMGRATRLVSLPRGRPPVHIARLGGYYNLKGYRHAHAWVGNTQGIRDYLVREGLDAGHVHYIGNFVDTVPVPQIEAVSACRREFKIPQEALLIVSAGRLHPNKGFSDLLQAFARLPQAFQQHPLWLLIAGDGELAAELHQQTARLGIADRVCWAGWQNDVGRLLDAADLFVCPSRHEPLGNIILEAWAHHAPVIATRTDGALELATDGTNALLTPCNDPAALAIAIEFLLHQGEQARKTLGQAGFDTLVSQHGRESVLGRYRALYQQLSRKARHD